MDNTGCQCHGFLSSDVFFYNMSQIWLNSVALISMPDKSHERRILSNTTAKNWDASMIEFQHLLYWLLNHFLWSLWRVNFPQRGVSRVDSALAVFHHHKTLIHLVMCGTMMSRFFFNYAWHSQLCYSTILVIPMVYGTLCIVCGQVYTIPGVSYSIIDLANAADNNLWYRISSSFVIWYSSHQFCTSCPHPQDCFWWQIATNSNRGQANGDQFCECFPGHDTKEINEIKSLDKRMKVFENKRLCDLLWAMGILI